MLPSWISGLRFRLVAFESRYSNFMDKIFYFCRINIELAMLYYQDENSWKLTKLLTHKARRKTYTAPLRKPRFARRDTLTCLYILDGTPDQLSLVIFVWPLPPTHIGPWKYSRDPYCSKPWGFHLLVLAGLFY